MSEDEKKQPKFTIRFESAKVVNLETGEERTFERLQDAAADPIAGKGLRNIDQSLQQAGGSAIQEEEENLGAKYRDVQQKPLTLKPEDEEAIHDLIHGAENEEETP